MNLSRFIMYICSLVASSAAANSSNPSLLLKDLGSVHIPDGVEIVSHDPVSGKIYAVGANGYMVFDFDEYQRFSILHTQSFSKTQEWQPTSIATDPIGRGFVACAWIPTPTDRVPGVIQIIDTDSDKPVWQLNAGFHPDCIAFTPDGRYLIAANECEPGERDLPGGISIFDLSGIGSAQDFVGMNEITQIDFSDHFLHEEVRLDVLRISPELRATPGVDLEPEYLAPTNQGVWVGLQENNGLAYFEFESQLWTKVYSLGTRSHAFDASDLDGVQINVQQGFQMLAQPDTILITEIGDQQYILHANEGEKADSETVRLADAIDSSLIDPAAIRRLRLAYPGDRFDMVTRVWISSIDGDLDGDGDIDLPSVLGSRSLSITDPRDGSLVWDSGSHFERLTSQLWPERFNSEDGRSDNAGPEPEGIAVGTVGERRLVCVGLERTDVVLMYDITDPYAPRYLDAQPLNSACSMPEGLSMFTLFDDRTFLAVASEEGGCLTMFEIVEAD